MFLTNQNAEIVACILLQALKKVDFDYIKRQKRKKSDEK